MSYYVQDTRGYIDSGPSCSECGACECEYHGLVGPQAHEAWNATHPDEDEQDQHECIGLSYVYCNPDDGADNLCESCYQKMEVEA